MGSRVNDQNRNPGVVFEGHAAHPVGGTDHMQMPRTKQDDLLMPANVRGHAEPWQKAAFLPNIAHGNLKYEGERVADIGGRDHFGSGGDFDGMVPDNYHAFEPHKQKIGIASQHQRPLTPSSKYARGEKVTPFHVRRTMLGEDGVPIGRESWDTIKHLPGLTNTSARFNAVGESNFVSKFGPGFQRRRQGDIQQDVPRKAAEHRQEVKITIQAQSRKDYIDENMNRNTFNPITGQYWGDQHNPAFQEMITRAKGASMQDRYTHHVKRSIPVSSNGECSDCKVIPEARTALLGREGMSVKKATVRGSVKGLFQGHDGYVVPRVSAQPAKPSGLHALN